MLMPHKTLQILTVWENTAIYSRIEINEYLCNGDNNWSPCLIFNVI